DEVGGAGGIGQGRVVDHTREVGVVVAGATDPGDGALDFGHVVQAAGGAFELTVDVHLHRAVARGFREEKVVPHAVGDGVVEVAGVRGLILDPAAAVGPAQAGARRVGHAAHEQNAVAALNLSTFGCEHQHAPVVGRAVGADPEGVRET